MTTLGAALIKIAHRGNINGPSGRENEPNYLLEAIALGYEVEVDVWGMLGGLWLGHDKPQYQLDAQMMNALAEKAWFHCKDVEALDYFSRALPNLRYFWHESDKYTLTSDGHVWVYPEEAPTKNSIIVDLDLSLFDTYKSMVYAVCTDYPGKLN
jgi:hypothetical protein